MLLEEGVDVFDTCENYNTLIYLALHRPETGGRSFHTCRLTKISREYYSFEYISQARNIQY